MNGYLEDYMGDIYELPALLTWSACHTAGYAADSFELCCLYESSMAKILSDSIRFRAEHDGETVFYGVVDEYEITLGENGRTASISGRGFAALLIDNEAEAAEYEACALSDILARHVRPYGITDIIADSLPPVSGFTVETGSSQWKALCSFTRFSGGITPYFTKSGTLVISGSRGARRRLGPDTAYSELSLREKRYGVISEVLVKSPNTSATVFNEAFRARGGNARRIVTVPRKTGFDFMRYTGAYQIEMSERDSVLISVTLPELFCAFPNDIIEFSSDELGITGVYSVETSECWADAESAGTKLELILKR